MMPVNLLWTGNEYSSLENCVVAQISSGFFFTSEIVGRHRDKSFKVNYRIKTNCEWETISFEVEFLLGTETRMLKYESDGRGNWRRDGHPLPEFNGCVDIDITLTPLTNSFPINRLSLARGEEREILALYIDLMDERLSVKKQKYVRLSEFEYRFENVPNDFEATILVDENGFVVHYPFLFTRIADERN